MCSSDLGLDFGGELRTQAEIDASNELGDWNETGITFENTANSTDEQDSAQETMDNTTPLEWYD